MKLSKGEVTSATNAAGATEPQQRFYIVTKLEGRYGRKSEKHCRNSLSFIIIPYLPKNATVLRQFLNIFWKTGKKPVAAAACSITRSMSFPVIPSVSRGILYRTVTRSEHGKKSLFTDTHRARPIRLRGSAQPHRSAQGDMDNGRAASFSIEMTGKRKDAFYVILNFTFYILHSTLERFPFDCAGKVVSRRTSAGA